MAVTGRNRRRPPGNARTMGVKDKPSNSRRRPPSNAKKMTVDKAKVMEASKSGKGTVSAKDKKTLRNASIRESVPTGKKKGTSVSTKGGKPSGGKVSTKVKDKKLPAKQSGRNVAKTAPKRTVKNMGKASVVPKKTLGTAKNVAKLGGITAVAVGTIGASMERTSHLATNGKLYNPMDKFGDKAIYGDRLTKKKTTQMPLPKSKPLYSGKPTVKAPQKPVKKTSKVAPKVTTKPAKKPVSKPVTSPKTATSGWKSQTAPKTKARLAKGNPTQARPKPTPIKPKKSKLPSSAQFIQDSPWDD